MVAWSELLLPSLLAAVLVFFVSSFVHMVLKWHNGDYKKLANEDEVRAVIRKGSPAPGVYILPHCLDHNQLANPEMTKKFEEGPNGRLELKPNGKPALGPHLAKWFVYSLVISLLAGYVGRITLMRGTEYMLVFQVVGAASWLAYSWQAPSDSIWKGQPWGITVRYMADGLMYSLVTAGAFAWLWPR